MARILTFCFTLMFLGCMDTSISEADLHYLNGYWEIAEVEFPDGATKEYTVNTNIDFIQLEDGKGFRKKLQPKFDGSYGTSHDAELFTINLSNDIITMHYASDFNDWEEKLVQLDSMSFSVINAEGIQYRYKRFQPIVIPK